MASFMELQKRLSTAVAVQDRTTSDETLVHDRRNVSPAAVVERKVRIALARRQVDVRRN